VESSNQDPWNDAVAAVVAALRRDADLTQDDVATVLGISRNTLVSLENGRREMTVPELMKFAKLVKLSPSVIVDRIVRWRR
jgi:DNA-binding XRE family transcriptional regulator